MLRKIRTILALFFFLFITLLFLDFTGTLQQWFGWMAKIQFLPALLALNAGIILLLIILTLIFGRIYCSVICPLGVFQDAVAWIHNRFRRNPYSYSKGKNLLRYIMLGIMIVAFIIGIHSMVALLAPYSAYGRIVTNLFQPLYLWGNNVLANIAQHYDSYAFYSVDVVFKGVVTLVVSIVTFVVIAVLAWKNGRTYCNTICPVGTLLSFLSRFSWLKIRIDLDKCITCGKCGRNCKASCIDSKNHKIDYSRCVVCGDCIENCSTNALSYCSPLKFRSAKQKAVNIPTKSVNEVDKGKRLFLLGSTIATTTAVLAQQGKKVDGGLAVIKDKVAPKRITPILPPGAWSASLFAKRCTACQLCVSECPNDVLRPSTNLLTLMQPTVSYELGYCRPECVRCSEVCPTDAIQPITKADKSSIQRGHAVWIRKNCIPITDGQICGNCARHCPVGAIEMIPDAKKENSFVPAIDEARCIGCGACENLCPARPFSAIYVEGHEQHKNI